MKKLPIEHSKKILNQGERKYSDEEVEKIRDLLYTFAQIEYDMIKDLSDKGLLEEFIIKVKANKND